MKNLILLISIFVANFSLGQTQNSKYYKELNKIKDNLNTIENVDVLNIWGHEDVTLEEISARIKIDEKGEIVLNGLSKDSYNYPKSIPISEVGGYSFTIFSCSGGIAHTIDVGSESEFFKKINQEFKSAQEVIKNYDAILEVVEGLKKEPEINHFDTGNSEHYILVHKKKSIDRDPIFNLFGVEKLFEYAKELEWNNPKCYFSKK